MINKEEFDKFMAERESMKLTAEYVDYDTFQEEVSEESYELKIGEENNNDQR